MSWLAEDTEEPRDLSALSRQTGLSPTHFQRVFTRYAGISPKRYCQQLMAGRARAALEEGASVLDAAIAAGVSGPGRLHDLFVAVEGMTPGEYKRRAAELELRWSQHPTRFGTATVAVHAGKLCAIHFTEDAPEAAIECLQERWPGARLRPDASLGETVFRPILAALDADRLAPLAVLLKGTNFQLKVWEALLRIPPGKTMTYGEIARDIAHPNAVRAVGQAVGANPLAWLIPCHRVIRANGALGGYRWGCERKREMLAWEQSHHG